MLRFSYHVFFLAILLLPGSPYLFADYLHLRDGTRVEGKVELFDGQLFTLRLNNGQSQTLKKEVVSLMELTNTNVISVPANSSAQPSSEVVAPAVAKGPFETPTETFLTWRKAAATDDIATMVKCYASFNQKQTLKDLKKISKSKRRDMQEAAIQTHFFPNDPIYQGERANLEVTWQKGLMSDVQILHFILEGNEWKIVQ